MSAHTNDFIIQSPAKIGVHRSKQNAEIHIATLMKHEATGFLFRSIYGKYKDDTEIAKEILSIINLKTRPRESELLSSLLSAASNNIHDISIFDNEKTYEVLLEFQKLKIMEILDPRKKTVSVYFPDGAYREQVGGILNKLKDYNYNAIAFVGTICNDKHEKNGQVFYGGHGIVEHMNFVDLFICATYAHDLPKCSKKVYFMHDIHDSPVSKEEDVLKMIAEYDYHFIPSPSVLERVTKQIQQARAQGHLKEEKEIGLIRGGYIKLDQNLKLFEKFKKEEKVLIHAPTVFDKDIEDYACLPEHSELIIEALLENFPDYKIIFRPHPHTAKSAPALRIVDKHKNNSRFLFDDNASFYMSNYAKSALMITDFSGTAFTYAFTTLRPVLFFSHNEQAFQNKFEDFEFIRGRAKIGIVTQNIDELIDKIQGLLKEKNQFESRIKNYRDSLIYNLGNSEKYFLENIDCILNGQKHSDWTYLNANPLPPRLVEEGYKGFNIVHYKNNFIALSQDLGNIDMEKLLLSEANLDFKRFVGSSKAEAKGYVDGINHSMKYIEKSPGYRLEIKRLEKIISNGKTREETLTRELKEKVGLLEQLMIQIDTADDKLKHLTKEVESSNLKMNALKKELAGRKNVVDTKNPDAHLNALTNISRGKHSKRKLSIKEVANRKNHAEVWAGELDAKKRKLESLAKDLGGKTTATETLAKELALREKWVHILREKLKATVNQRENFSNELERLKSSFLYRLIK